MTRARRPMPEGINSPHAYVDFKGSIGRTFLDSEPGWPPERAPAPGSPNVVIVLIDDMGYSDLGCYGGEITTPHADRLADRGVRLTNFHATPMCAPTRASLLTGVNHHLAGVADVLDDNPGFPGYLGELREDIVTLPEALRAAGYGTMMVGKWHLCRESHTSSGSPRRSWPLQRGFDEYYGVLTALTNLHHPHQLTDGNSTVHVDTYPDGYYLTDDLTDRALRMIRDHRSHDPVAPFFLYFAHLAVHAPLHAKRGDIARHADSYVDGWDVIRRRRYERLVELGILRPGTALPDNRENGLDVAALATLAPKAQSVFARYMAVYAAMVESIDRSVGRIVSLLEDLGELDNTIIILMSDNGATHEGGQAGSCQYFDHIPAFYLAPSDLSVEVSIESAYRMLDELGGPRTMPVRPRGWAQASNTPFRLYKSFTHAGGRQVPCIISWPDRLLDHGSLRSQYSHVTDVLPTVLDLIGATAPTERNGTRTVPPSGVTAAGFLLDADQPTRHDEQYYERGGNLAYYSRGWEIVARSRRHPGLEQPAWELYRLDEDPTESDNLARKRPDKVSRLEQRWEAAAWENQVFPLDDRTGLRVAWGSAAASERLGAVTLLPGASTMSHFASLSLINTRSFTIEIRLDHTIGSEGVLVAHGDQGGGYLVYVENDMVTMGHNHRGTVTKIESGSPLQPGPQTVVVNVDAQMHQTWRVTLRVGSSARSSPVALPMLWGLAPFQGIDIGADRRSPVIWDLYVAHGSFPYQGTLHSVSYVPGELALDSPYRISLAEARKAARAIADAIQ